MIFFILVCVCYTGVTLLSALIELANDVNYVLDNTQVYWRRNNCVGSGVHCV